MANPNPRSRPPATSPCATSTHSLLCGLISALLLLVANITSDTASASRADEIQAPHFSFADVNLTITSVSLVLSILENFNAYRTWHTNTMAPVLLDLVRRAFAPGRPSDAFSAQWRNPGDVFSVLLILGGDIVARALAQLVGSKITPVAFSFGNLSFQNAPSHSFADYVVGWVAFAVTAVVRAIGDNKLMPPPETPCQVTNAKSGYTRSNNSWIISRIVRDFDVWKDKQVSAHLETMLKAKHDFDTNKANQEVPGSGNDLAFPKKAGLCVSVYKAEQAHVGAPGYDSVYWFGWGTSILQLGIAAIPCGVYGDWGIMLITVVGILLSFATGSLPQWKEEKWACRNKSKKDVIVTTGNGSQHAVLILGQGKGLDLEDLAAGPSDIKVSTQRTTRFALLALALLWVLLLITAAGIKENTWFLLAVGGLGICQNIFAAGIMRDPAAYGMPLTFVGVVGSAKVMDTLFQVEDKYPYAGASMLATFFPGDLKEGEKAKWKDLEATAKERWTSWKASYVS